jgi:WD40 repeat protein
MPGRSIAALAFAPDSRTLAFTTASGVIVLARSEVDGRGQRWQPATFADAQRHGHIAPVKGIAWAADSKVLASCSPDGTVRLWDRGTARQIRILQNTDLNDAIAFSADGKFLSAVGFLDRNSRVAIRVWDTRDYRELRLIRSTQGTWLLGGLALSPDGKLAGASRRADPSPDGFVHRWDIASGKEQGEPVACTLIRSAPALFPDGKSIAVGDDARVIRIVDTGTGRVLHRLEGHSEAIWKVILSPDSRFLASFSEASRQSDGDIRLWDTATGKEVQRLRFSAQQNVTVAFAADSSLLAAGWNDGSIRVWETTSWRTVHRYSSPAGVECLAFSPEGKWLASSGSDTAILIWPLGDPSAKRR